MSSTFARLFQNVGTTYSSNSKHIPMLNEISATLNNYYGSMTQIARKKRLMGWFKQIPELSALSTKFVRDIVSDFHFEPVKGFRTNGVKKANLFVAQSNYKRIKYSRVLDRLITGEDFLWLGKLKKKQIKEHAIKFVKEKYGKLETKEAKAMSDILCKEVFNVIDTQHQIDNPEAIDEDIIKPRMIRHMASSTMQVIYDQYDLKNYVQDVGGKKEPFSPDEVIRGTFFDVDGKVNGFSNVEGIIVQLELLRFMWQNMLSVQRNGGSMDKIYTLEDMKDVSSPAYKRIEEQLKSYKQLENKHGSMLFTGKVNVTELQQLDSMQFKDLGLYITGLVAMQWSIPRSSIPFIVGGTNTKDDTGGNSERGYWDTVEYCQKIDADIDNNELWIPYFGVRMVYDTKFIQKDVQVETAKQLKYNNIKLTNEMLRASGKQIKPDLLTKMVGLVPEDLEVYEEPVEEIDSTLNNQVSKDDAKPVGEQNVSDKKRREQNSVIASRGAPPTGVGKERKEFEGKMRKTVSFETFITVYNEDKAYHPGKAPRVFKTSNDLYTSFEFASSDFAYLAIVLNTDLEDRKVQLMSLSGNIYGG